MQLDNTLIIVVIFAVIILAVIVAYRRRIKTAVKALGAELNIEAEGRSEFVSPPPPAASAEAVPPPERTVTASGAKGVAIGGSGKGATIVTGSDNTVGEERQRKR
jgi:hypothetical protein